MNLPSPWPNLSLITNKNSHELCERHENTNILTASLQHWEKYHNYWVMEKIKYYRNRYVSLLINHISFWINPSFTYLYCSYIIHVEFFFWCKHNHIINCTSNKKLPWYYNLWAAFLRSKSVKKLRHESVDKSNLERWATICTVLANQQGELTMSYGVLWFGKVE